MFPSLPTIKPASGWFAPRRRLVVLYSNRVEYVDRRVIACMANPVIMT
jgi:hypothetical protein